MSGIEILVDRLKRTRTEEGFAVEAVIAALAMIIALVACLAISLAVMDSNAQRRSIEREVKNAHTVIYDSYSRASEGVEDKEELKKILSEATEDYEALAKDSDVEVSSLLINHETIEVRIIKTFNATLTTYGSVTYEAHFVTGNNSPLSNKVADNPVNENGIYDFAPSSKSP